MNEPLAKHLTAIDSQLLDYLDDDGEFPVDLVLRLHRFANAMVEGSATPELVAADWADFYDLVDAYVAVYASAELQDLYDRASLEAAVAEGRFIPLGDTDRVLLVQLTDELETYPGFPELQQD